MDRDAALFVFIPYCEIIMIFWISSVFLFYSQADICFVADHTQLRLHVTGNWAD